jgi:cytochrome c556
MKVTRTALLVAAVVASPSIAQQIKPEDQITMRRAAYNVIQYRLVQLDSMAKGKVPFNKEEAVRSADTIALLAPLPKRFFGEGTGGEQTRAKPEIWAKRADFDAKMDAMIKEAAQFAQSVKASNDAAGLARPIDALDKACKNCHDDYRVRRGG